MPEAKEVKVKKVREEAVPELGEDYLVASLQEVEKEINTGFRLITLKNFRDNEELKVRLQVPSVEVDAECARIYAEHYNELLFSDKKVPTKEEMEEKMNERGIWTQEHDDQIESFDDRMQDLMREGQEMHYKKRVNKKRLKELKTQLKTLRDDKSRLMAKKQNMLSQTIDSLSDLVSLEYKLYRCVTDEEDIPLWTTWDEFKKEKNRGVLTQLLQAGMIFWNGLPQDILSLLPEDMSLRGVISGPSPEQPSGE